jgi:hypothetical protein
VRVMAPVLYSPFVLGGQWATLCLGKLVNQDDGYIGRFKRHGANEISFVVDPIHEHSAESVPRKECKDKDSVLETNILVDVRSP